MPHADSALVPASLTTKLEFWRHVYEQLELLIADERNWVSNLANASSLLYNSLIAFPTHFGPDEKAVNWCGFYILDQFFPSPRRSPQTEAGKGKLLLGPFNGRPACQYINVNPGKARGVCADAYLQQKTVIVQDVNSYPGHIACDGDTNSEIVIPLLLDTEGATLAIGVLDLDCLSLNSFNDEDRDGLERIAALLVKSCDW
ncbi:GAF domain-like protein [Mycena floridula]|nr:GAF domain-like protein [Mycena floridula]